MRKLLLGLVGATALTVGTTAHAAVTIDFSTLIGELGDDQVYSSGPMTVTASGYTDVDVDEHLYGKSQGSGEKGIGLAEDPSGQHEIYAPDSFIQLDVTQLFGLASSVDFFMNSSTGAEGWAVYGNDTDAAGALGGVLLLSGTDQSMHTLPDFGTYDFYNFFATGAGSNVLLGGLSITEAAAVPEPASWAMMLLGFGAVGFALRRHGRKGATLRQLA
jgi:hypothetical protein